MTSSGKNGLNIRTNGTGPGSWIMERTIALVLDPSTAKYLGRSLFYISSTGRVSLLVEQ